MIWIGLHSFRCWTALHKQAYRSRRLALLLLLGLTACTGGVRAPVEGEGVKGEGAAPVTRQGRPTSSVVAPPANYTVRRGDTLYAIAWRYRLDHLDIARWNKLGSGNRILVGQKIRLSPPPATAKKSSSKNRTAKKSQAPDATQQKKRKQVKTANTVPVRTGNLRWQWPASGKHKQLTTTFGKVGLQIFGKRGSKIRAAESGTVVYAGSGLIGYGRLIIIKHSDTFLSAYAHNDALLVKEGAKVRAGQTVARMGDSGAQKVQLHFEIRRNGKPVPPLKYLPSQNSNAG